MQTEIKICGLTNSIDATAALECGADYLGFVLYPASPRAITKDQLLAIVSQIGDKAGVVPVFVNAPTNEILDIARAVHARAVQIHGDEPANAFKNFEFPVWRAIHFRAGAPCPAPSEWPAQRYVVDAAPADGTYGGTGTKADWTQAHAFAHCYPTMLAGGLTVGNVRHAIKSVAPLGVDVASGVEQAPGKKDLAAVRAFVKACRAMEAEQ